MARSSRFYVGPMKSGQQTNLKPFAITDDAYERLINAYQYRGSIRKRFGTRFFKPATVAPEDVEHIQSRLRVKLGATDAAGLFNGTVPLDAGVPKVTPAIGQLFSIEDSLFTVTALGNPAALMRRDNLGLVATFDTTTGAVIIDCGIALAAKNVYYYPALPVMGITNLEEGNVNDEITVAFDTVFAYYPAATGWEQLPSVAGGDYFTGSDSDFFWCYPWRGVNAQDNLLFITNFTAGDGMRTWNNATSTWTAFAPIYSGANTIETARIIIPFKQRLLLLNTVENGVSHVNRCRYSWVGNPTDPNAFNEALSGSGNWEDVPVKENIITALFLRDRLIVYCERSTWELVYTGYDIRPFIFQQIDSSLGAESTFSQISFDDASLGVGNVGIHSCNGSSVKRIDDLIPDDVHRIHNSFDGPKRVCGIRDFYAEMAYWTIPSTKTTADNPYPDRVLVYNYKTGTWSYNDDSFTFFGYLQNTVQSALWETDYEPMSEDNSTWENPNVQAKARNIAAGNQQGFMLIVDTEKSSNEESLQITNLVDTGVEFQLTVINHNLSELDFVLVKHCKYDDGSTGDLNNKIYRINEVIDENTVSLLTEPYVPLGGKAYVGGGTLARVSQIDILTKQYSFFAKDGLNTAINKIDILAYLTNSGEFSLDYFTGTADESLQDASEANGSSLGDATVETYPLSDKEIGQSQVWRSIYVNAEGPYVQMRILLSDEQMVKEVVEPGTTEISYPSQQDLRIHGIIYNAYPGQEF